MAVNADNVDISGKVALVTGGANGIGKAIVEIMLCKEAKGVGIVDIDPINGQEVTASLQKTFGDDRIVFVKCDVTSNEQLKSAFEDINKKFGRLDIVCNNAGICNEYDPVKTIATNLIPVIIGTYLAVEFMGTQNGGNGGVVINTGSVSGITAHKNVPVYSASKYGVVGFTRAVAKEPNVEENGVRVSAVCPELVDTGMIANLKHTTKYTTEEKLRGKSFLRPSYIAEVVVKLIEEARYNGCACVVSEHSKMTVVEEPDIPYGRKLKLSP
ncbi:15-hydroxyprostaglandin dehydrogenase [NAD(+)]-like [Ptychodera flava]|uniref:15-hydroxyprostaglandin dehydrogenase [NAD(+)]-like n=1 Tax=Ptychodera flava TaxID=63121 RepID=UPI003969D1B1